MLPRVCARCASSASSSRQYAWAYHYRRLATQPERHFPNSPPPPLSPRADRSPNVPASGLARLISERLPAVRGAILGRSRRIAAHTGLRISELGLKVNTVTGYEEVERRKEQVAEAEIHLKALRTKAKVAKDDYEQAVSERSTSQRDVNSLLERKHAWTDADVSRFTTLVRSDHSSSQAVITTSASLKDAEAAVDSAFSRLTQAILERYHEEQVWSDKIRSVSTWANLLGLAINLIVFVGAIAVVEPWKRRRLVERLEEQTAGLVQRIDGGLQALGDKLDNLEPPSATLPADTDFHTDHLPSTLPAFLSRYGHHLDRLWEPSPARDSSVIALSGAFCGIVGTWLVSVFLQAWT